ncbi:MAG TPA: XRE family transcriptional regulator [Halothiobacillus sp.]|nr:XRE family transcriptional regulator [Halothiobacillus sp.]
MSKRDTAQKSNPTDKPVPPERLIFARNFKKARKEAGMTQEAIRERTGFAQPFISEVENGRSTINLDNAAQLAAAVGKPLWKLLTP